MAIEIIPVKTLDQIETVAVLAKEIWEQHFTPIIGTSQVKYMLDRFQSIGAIEEQINGDFQYFLASTDNSAIGYTGLVAEPDIGKLMISKIYVKRSARGKGAGTALLDFIEEKCRDEEISSLWLTVNRFNNEAISWYQHYGFETTGEVKKDIGGGFFMDDFIMHKTLGMDSY